MIIKDSSPIKLSQIPQIINIGSKRHFFFIIITLALLVIVAVSVGLGVNYGIKIRQTNAGGALKGLLHNLRQTGFKIIPNYIKGTLARPEHFYIDIAHLDFQKIAYNRKISLANGGISEEIKQEKYPATLTHNNQSYKVNLEMIGQNIDHISNSRKWSLKVRLRGDNAVLGMKEFSLLVPNARGSYNYSPIHEWICHQLEKDEGLITLRYDFVDVTINGNYIGIYALEEHFDKHLIESNKFREGIIFKPGLGDISVYNENRIKADPTMGPQLSLLRHLWKSFWANDIPANILFAIDKLAKRYAIADLVNGHHIHWLGNTMFYFNPVTRMVEPIGREWESPYHDDFDLYIENPVYDPVFHQKIFGDLKFVEQYVRELDRVSQPEYLDHFFPSIADSLEKNMQILNKDYPAYGFSKAFLYDNQKLIHNKLHPAESCLNSYLRSFNNKTMILSCANLSGLPVEIIGVTFDKGPIIYPLEKAILSGTRKGSSPDYEDINFKIAANVEMTDQSPDGLEIQYKLLGMPEIRADIVFPWAQSEIDKYVLYPVKNDGDYLDNDFIYLDNSSKSIYIKNGHWVLKKNLIIPQGYTLICNAGTHFDLQDSAKILTYSPIMFSGSIDDPISIYSSDLTGQGLIVLNTKIKSVMNFVNFENLCNSRQEGWELTGCVTFYESPVDISNCRFSKNRQGDDFVNLIRSEFVLSQSEFTNTFSDALDVDFCEGKISSTNFFNCGNDALDASGSFVEMSDIIINRTGDKGLSAGEKSRLVANRITINEAEIAVASKDCSEMELDDIRISTGKVGLAAYQKKPEFGPASILATNITLSNVPVPYLLEEASAITMNGEKIVSNRKNVKDILYGAEFGKASK